MAVLTQAFRLPAWLTMEQRITACGVSSWAGRKSDFKRVHYSRAVILHAVSIYARQAISYRDFEGIFAEGGVFVDMPP